MAGWNLGEVWEAVADALPDAPALAHGGARRTWAEMDRRADGVARALLASSFRLLKDLGMTEAALSVDAENPSGALQLYESMGFQVVRRGTSYRKLMDP